MCVTSVCVCVYLRVLGPNVAGGELIELALGSAKLARIPQRNVSGSGLPHTAANPLLCFAAQLPWICYLHHPWGTGNVSR